MKNKKLIAIIMVLGCVSLHGQIKINTAADLAIINNCEDALKENYLLTSDLTLENWVPIGHEENPFKGTFDGKACIYITTNDCEYESREDENKRCYVRYVRTKE